jgi:hypothetical protein
MDPIEITLLIEAEKKKCLNIIKKYYNKYGDESIQKLYTYLQSQSETIEDINLKNELNYDMEILNQYLKQESSE